MTQATEEKKAAEKKAEEAKPEAPKVFEKRHSFMTGTCQHCGEVATLAKVFPRKGGRGAENRPATAQSWQVCKPCYDEDYHGCRIHDKTKKHESLHKPGDPRRMIV